MNPIEPVGLARPSRRYTEALLELIAAHSRRVPLAVFGVLILIASLTFPVSRTGTAIWLMGVVAVLGLRYVILSRLPSRVEQPLGRRMAIAVTLSAANGMAHGACLVFFPFLTDIERAIQSLILAGLCTAAVATTLGNRLIFLAYWLPVFPPLVVLWATGGSWSIPDRTDAALALAVGTFGLVLLMLARDTDRQFRETILMRTEQEQTNQQLQAALHDAGVADRAKTRFLASASHDLRQPIHALSLFSAALKRQPLPAEAETLAIDIDESVGVLANQLDALLDISKLDAGVVTPDPTLVDLTAMMRRIAREYEADIAARGLELRVRLDDDCRTMTDPLLLERVVRNLLNNAVRYTQRGAIDIECRAKEGQCCIAIVDTGIGIAPEEQKRIFGEFYQVSRDGSASEGLGLGLSIVTRLLALLDLPLVLTSTPGEGTRVEVALIREQGTMEDKDDREIRRLSGLKVLVVDDDPAVRSGMSALLSSLGAVPCPVSTVAEADACSRRESFDLVLADLQLGTESGIEAVRRCRAARRDLPAVLITGDTGADGIRLAHESGIEVLHKPVLVDALERKIAEVISCR